jgi:hypothetical protein
MHGALAALGGGDLLQHQLQRRRNLSETNRPATRKEKRGNKMHSGAYRDRTGDPLLAKQVLSQLS